MLAFIVRFGVQIVPTDKMFLDAAAVATAVTVFLMACVGFVGLPLAFAYQMLLRFPSSVQIDGDRLSVRLAWLTLASPLGRIRVHRSRQSFFRPRDLLGMRDEEVLLIRIPWRGTVRVTARNYANTEILARLIPKEEEVT